MREEIDEWVAEGLTEDQSDRPLVLLDVMGVVGETSGGVGLHPDDLNALGKSLAGSPLSRPRTASVRRVVIASATR